MGVSMGMGEKTEIGFYQLKKWPLERALPRLLERAHGAGMRVVVRCASKPRLDALNDLLWTYDPGSFLAHGGPDDGAASDQPIYLTLVEENPNLATVLMLTDGLDAGDIDDFERCLELFDGNDPDALAAARARWQARKDAGYPLAYWAQSDDGKWEKQS